MILFLLAVYASLLAAANATACSIPAAVPTADFPSPWSLQSAPTSDGTYLDCTNGFVAKLTANSSAFTMGGYFKCDTTTGTWKFLESQWVVPAQLSCGVASATPPYCNYYLRQSNGEEALLSVYPGKEQICASGLRLQKTTNLLYTTNVTCEDTVLTYVDTGLIKMTGGYPVFQCGTPPPPKVTTTPPTPPTTTTKPTTTTPTTTKLTTTTKKPDVALAAADLITVTSYYNYLFGVHSYCASQACINAIQSNGIGYDMVNGKFILGRVADPNKLVTIRAKCPTGSEKYFYLLSFQKIGNAYIHNFNEDGLVIGYVATAYGACGATKAIKRWRSRYSDDMLYGTDFEWNTWYSGMVQDGGKIQFYMWENE